MAAAVAISVAVAAVAKLVGSEEKIPTVISINTEIKILTEGDCKISFAENFSMIKSLRE